MTEPAIQIDHVSKKFARSLKRAMAYGLVDIARAALIPHRFRSDALEARVTDAESGMRDSGQEREADHGPRNPGSRIPHPVSRIPDPASRIPDPASRIPHPTPSALDPDQLSLRPTEFWAIRDVSLTIPRGACVGVIGHNGAGKSTLFSLLSGIYGPTLGRISYRGRLQALIALGAGFHPALTGRENIYINASILGLRERQIDAILDRIIDFSELKEFVDMPVKNYSSGMMVRLGFSVAAHLEPDILLIDEVLAVGDMGFQRKCLEFIRRIIEGDVTVVLVSHNTATIEAICSRVIWMHRGQVRADGDAKEIVSHYANHYLREEAEKAGAKDEAGEDGDVCSLEEISLVLPSGEQTTDLPVGSPFDIRVAYHARERIERPHFHIVIYSGTTRVAQASMLADGQAPPFIEGRGVLTCRWKGPTLMPNPYRVHVAVRTREATVDVFTAVKNRSFSVSLADEAIRNSNAPCPATIQTLGALVEADYKWHLEPEE